MKECVHSYAKLLLEFLSCCFRRGYFNACVRNVRYGETKQNMREITNDYIKKNKVLEGCELNYCHKPDPICKNNGKCFAVEKTNVTCDCEWTGFTGKTCTKRKLWSISNEAACMHVCTSGLVLGRETS